MQNLPGLHGFFQILNLRFFRDVVLPSRYRDRMVGNVSALDRAFGAYLDVGEDVVSKRRAEIRNRIPQEAFTP
jgi:hypothetical protein